MKRVTGFSLSNNLIHEIDERRGDIPRSRVVEKMLWRVLEEEKNNAISE